MADFTGTQATITSVSQATNLLNALQSLYSQAKAAQALLALYQAGSNPAFNAAINAMFTPAQRAEIADMMSGAAALTTDWETNHRSPLGLP